GERDGAPCCAVGLSGTHRCTVTSPDSLSSSARLVAASFCCWETACWASCSLTSSKGGTSDCWPPAWDCCSTTWSYCAFSSSSLGGSRSASCSWSAVGLYCAPASFRTCSALTPCCSSVETTSSAEPRPFCSAISSRVASMSSSVASIPASCAPCSSRRLSTSCSATCCLSAASSTS